MAVSLSKGQKVDLTKGNPGLSKITGLAIGNGFAAVSGALGLFLLGLKSVGWQLVEVDSFKALEESGVVQSSHALNSLWFFYAFVPTIGCILAWIVWEFYRLKDKDVQIMADCNSGLISREEAEKRISKKY